MPAKSLKMPPKKKVKTAAKAVKVEAKFKVGGGAPKGVVLPKGYQAITATGDYAPSWDFKHQKSIEGVLRNIKDVHLEKKGKRAAKDTQVATISTEQGDVNVWMSAGLRSLFSLKKGSKVFVQYLGKKKIKGQSNPMNDFFVATQ